MADFNSPIYPAPGVGAVALQYVKAVVPGTNVTTVGVFTVARGQGRFFVTALIAHDPSTSTIATVGVSFGSASTSATALTPLYNLNQLNNAAANQFVQFHPGLQAGASVALALGGGDVLTANVVTAGAGSFQLDIVGYYL